MENNLISVTLYPIDVDRLSKDGFIRLYGLDPIRPDDQIGRSQVPEKWMPLFWDWTLTCKIQWQTIS